MEDERLRNFQVNLNLPNNNKMKTAFGLLEQGMVANVGKGADVAFNFLQYLEHEPYVIDFAVQNSQILEH
jgi:hypothetical protein